MAGGILAFFAYKQHLFLQLPLYRLPGLKAGELQREGCIKGGAEKTHFFFFFLIDTLFLQQQKVTCSQFLKTKL